MVGEDTGPCRKAMAVDLLMDLGNYLLDVYIHSRRLVLLSALVSEALLRWAVTHNWSTKVLRTSDH